MATSLNILRLPVLSIKISNKEGYLVFLANSMGQAYVLTRLDREAVLNPVAYIEQSKIEPVFDISLASDSMSVVVAPLKTTTRPDLVAKATKVLNSELSTPGGLNRLIPFLSEQQLLYAATAAIRLTVPITGQSESQIQAMASSYLSQQRTDYALLALSQMGVNVKKSSADHVLQALVPSALIEESVSDEQEDDDDAEVE